MKREKISADELKRDFYAVAESLRHESDSGCALIGGAYLEKMLGNLLKQFFVNCNTAQNLLDDGRPLGNAGAQNDAAYSVGLRTWKTISYRFRIY
jgi:hypothetical protein